MYLLKIEYFANTLEVTKDLKYDTSASNYRVMNDNRSNKSNEVQIDESENIKDDENTVIIESKDRPNNDREFFKKIYLPKPYQIIPWSSLGTYIDL